jgi:hypothetical protein
MLYRLILPDRPVEHDALVGVGNSPIESRAPESDGFRRNQDPFGVEPMSIVETLCVCAMRSPRAPAAPR